MTSELETLIPQPVTLEVAGKTLEILPIKVGRLPAFIRAVAPFLEVFKNGGEVNFIPLLANHGEAVLEACAIGANVERAWINDLDPAQLVKIAQVVIEVNVDFFTHQLAPAITSAAGVMIGRIAGLPASNG
jgi:hypothetical protein